MSNSWRPFEKYWWALPVAVAAFCLVFLGAMFLALTLGGAFSG